MADFTAELQNLRLSFPFLDQDQFTEISPLFPFSDNNSYQQGLEFPSETFPASIFHHNTNVCNQYPPIPICQVSASPGNGTEFHESCRKRKPIIISDNSENSSMTTSSAHDSEVLMMTKTKNNSRRGKRAKNSKEAEQPREVIHVRATRGEATDSHSLAERVRRGKINERLRCLQDIVPGCYKSMGMALVLDEIINYVQSLQNQVEFLSMKLTAASTFYDFNSESDAIETMQRAKSKEGYNSTWSL